MAFHESNSVERAALGPVGMFVGRTQSVFKAQVTDRTGKLAINEEQKHDAWRRREYGCGGPHVAKSFKKNYENQLTLQQKKRAQPQRPRKHNIQAKWEILVIETGAVGDEQSVIIRIGRQQIRTKETLDLFMRAAQSIPVRDSYEGADSDDIAELAGRTKDAIYGHFESKEEIFVALIAYHRQEHREKLGQSFTSDVTQISSWCKGSSWTSRTIRLGASATGVQAVHAAPSGSERTVQKT
jgi:hypothetical protein